MTKKNLMFCVPALFAFVASAPFTGCSVANAGGNDECAAPVVAVAVEEEKIGGEPLRFVCDDAAGTLTVSGKNFSAKFSAATGSLVELIYAGKNIIAGGNGPRLNAFRAVVNNDGWACGKWFAYGLFDMRHEALGAPHVSENDDGTISVAFRVRSQGKRAGTLKGDPRIQHGNAINGIPVEITLGRELGDDDFAFTTQQIWTVFPDGSVELAANIASNNPNADLPRLGYTMDVPAAFSRYSYYGRGPQENYNDRCSGAFFGIYSSSVAEQFVAYTKPQENANHEGVRWCALTDGQGAGAIFIAADGAFSAQALPVAARDMLFAANSFALDEKIAGTTATTLNLDSGVRGLGGASCGPDTENRDKVFAKSTDFGFIIRPVTAGENLSALANVSPSGAVPVAVVRDVAGIVSVSSKKPGEKILISVNDEPEREYIGPITFRNGGKIRARFASDAAGLATEVEFPKIDKLRLAVAFCSSQEGSDPATNLTDNDAGTIWHTAYSVTVANYPHWVDFDIGESRTIKGISYLPRQSGENGDVKNYEIFVSADGKNWGKPVASGAFPRDKAEKRVLFASPVQARFVRFRALSSQNGMDFASGAEFGVLAD